MWRTSSTISSPYTAANFSTTMSLNLVVFCDRFKKSFTPCLSSHSRYNGFLALNTSSEPVH